jgi:hypothetical protein
MAAMPQLLSGSCRRSGTILAIGIAASLPAGCSSGSNGPTTQPSTISQRQDRALQDPFGYTPDTKKSDMTVSGHGEFDKEGLQRDTDHVLNP